MPFAHPCKIYAGDYNDIDDAAIIVITAGANQKPGETRLDLAQKNVAIFKTIIPQISERNYQGIFWMSATRRYSDVRHAEAFGMPQTRVLAPAPCSTRRASNTSSAST